MAAEPLEQFARWTEPLLAALSDGERLKLARTLGNTLKRSQARRIVAQQNPDGTSFEPRKSPTTAAERASRTRRRIRNTMFDKLRTARFMRLRVTAGELSIGFIGRAARIARIHQYGEADQVQPGGPTITYPQRELLGFSDADMELVRDTIMTHLEAAAKSAR